VRVAIALARRCFSIFLENFHWIGWIAVALAWRTKMYRSRPWHIAATLAAVQTLAVTVLGGATLERYLLPVIPLMYIAFAAAWSARPSFATRAGQFALVAGLVLCLFWNPPYPYPYENNLAMVDFVRLHQRAADFVERTYPGQRITTAWPFSIELRRPACGYVKQRMAVQEIPGFRPGDVQALDPASVRVFVLFSRDWDAGWDLRRAPLVEPLMRKFYGYQAQIAPSDLERRFALRPAARWSERGQWIAVYEREAAAR
jgi:hypothetical protein